MNGPVTASRPVKGNHPVIASEAKQSRRPRGAALLTVLVAMMLISLMLFEFQHTTMIERQLAYNELNQLQAYYLAKTGVRIGLLRIALYGRAKRSPEIKTLGKNLPIDTYLDAIWNLPLPSFPPESSKIKELSKEDRDAAEKTLKQTHLTDGQSTHVITSESSKINLNFLAEIPQELKDQRLSFTSGTPKSVFEYIGRALVNLIEGFLKESENPAEEYGNLKPEEVAFDVIDWVTPGSNRMAGGAKDSYYESLKPPYKAKRNRFYTVDELKLVRGIDDRLYNKLRPHVTVYSYDGKININTASNTMIRALYPDFTDDDVKRISEEKAKLGQWATEKQFVQFVKDSLNRPGFATLYPEEKNYPFTVQSQSFLIESMGVIAKSKSQVQKIIRVGVALTSGKGGTLDSTITDAARCAATPDRFWDKYLNQCRSKPKNQAECISLTGEWQRVGTKDCCVRANSFGAPETCVEATGQRARPAEASAMRILYWSES